MPIRVPGLRCEHWRWPQTVQNTQTRKKGTVVPSSLYSEGGKAPKHKRLTLEKDIWQQTKAEVWILFLPILMGTVFKRFCLLLKFPLVSDLLLLLRMIMILETLLISITYFSWISKHFKNRKGTNSLLFAHQNLGTKQQHNWNLVLKCVCLKVL